MDQVYEGMTFEMPVYLGDHLAFLVRILIFSTAIPDLVFLLPIYFFAHFWIEKWSMLKICKLPPKYDPSLLNTATNIIGVTIFIHILASILVFTTQEIFPDQVLVYNPID